MGVTRHQNLQKIEKNGVKTMFLSVKTRKTPIKSRETAQKPIFLLKNHEKTLFSSVNFRKH